MVAPSPAAPAGADLHPRVLDWYARERRDLPWRRPDCSPWGTFVSEVMLQQTPVARVEPVWHTWVERWPTPADLAADTPGEAVRAWGRLGYPRRALRLHAAAGAMVEDHDGQVPTSADELRALPGVGAYTAAAVAAFAFGQHTTVVDTNIRRVLARVVGGTAHAAPSLTKAESERATALLPADAARAATWNVAAMELGALVCTARSPTCERCPLAQVCQWRAAGFPAYQGPARRTQAWHGTDRQVRGALLAVLRAAPGPVADPELRRARAEDDRQRARCLDSLVADGLVEPLAGGRYRLPS